MLELFGLEVETQGRAMTTALLALERNPSDADRLEECMRAAHSLKGAARIVGLDAGVSVAHAMEDCFVAAQLGHLVLRQNHIDRLLSGVDLLSRIGSAAETPAELGKFLAHFAQAVETPKGTSSESAEAVLLTEPAVIASTHAVAVSPPEPAAVALEPAAVSSVDAAAARADGPRQRDAAERVLRVTAEKLNRLLGLTGESLVESRWLKSFTNSLVRLKRLHHESSMALAAARESLAGQVLDEQTEASLSTSQRCLSQCEQLLFDRLAQLELFDTRSTDLANRLYDEALACSMRPFADAVPRFPRMIRDLSRTLGKEAHLEIIGESTQVDRDVLEKLDAPLGHLLRNAIDHGIESPELRRAGAKPVEGTIRMEARHFAGMLQINISDDGAGLDPDAIRRAIVRRKLTTVEFAAALSEAELWEFLFLPGFSLRDAVTETSGRGVGLDVVFDMVKKVSGTVRASSKLGVGTKFLLQLPLTLSVVRTLLVEVAGEPFAFPLAYISRTLMLPRAKIEMLEGRQLFEFEGVRIGLMSASQLLGGVEQAATADHVPIVIIGEISKRYGLAIDRFLGERELVVQPLDARLGKIEGIASAALMENGSPVLVVDVEDILRAAQRLASLGGLSKVPQRRAVVPGQQRKRVLVVDDSLTVRELERKLLDARGYEVEVAVDGMEGWNAARTGNFDLVMTDIDMPRMDGIELVGLIRADPNLKSIPVMIVSYKDRPEDRLRGLQAGADQYLTKGSFHDETLLTAVTDLIGEPLA